jgi:hypothetical protein
MLLFGLIGLCLFLILLIRVASGPSNNESVRRSHDDWGTHVDLLDVNPTDPAHPNYHQSAHNPDDSGHGL